MNPTVEAIAWRITDPGHFTPRNGDYEPVVVWSARAVLLLLHDAGLLWIKCSESLPANNVTVETKVEDAYGVPAEP